MNGGVGEKNIIRRLALPARPQVVEPQGLAECFARQHGPVERADRFDLQRGRLFQQCLYLRAVLADNVVVVASCLRCPRRVGGAGEGTKAPEGVGGEEELLRFLVGDHHLRPMNHRGEHKMKRVRTKGERPALANLQQAVVRRRVRAEELAEHREGFGVADKLHFRIPLRKAQDAAGVIRLHVGDHKVVRTAPVQLVRELGEPFVRRAGVHAVHDGDLLIQNEVGVVAHAHRLDRVLVFKEAEGEVVRAHAADGLRQGLTFVSDFVVHCILPCGIF